MLIPDAPPVGEMEEGGATVPEATYNVRVHKAEYVATPKSADAKGPYIKVQFVITGPGDNKYLGRMIFMNYSLSGPASFRLRELLTVTGHAADFKLEDDQQLVGLELGAVVTTQAASGGYPEKSQIRKHIPVLAAATV